MAHNYAYFQRTQQWLWDGEGSQSQINKLWTQSLHKLITTPTRLQHHAVTIS